MSLQTVPTNTNEDYFFSSAQIKHSGVHIGDGVFLTANHRPTPGGGNKANLAQGLPAEEYLGRTTEFDFTLPENQADWGPYLEGTLIHQAYDMALHTTNNDYSGSGESATMLIFSDPNEMSGNVVNAGYPKYTPGTNEINKIMYYSEGYLAPGNYTKHELGGGFIHTSSAGINVAGGMSGGGLFLEYDPDKDGVSNHYLIGQTTRTYGATAIADQYNNIGGLLKSLGYDANDFPRHVLISGQSTDSSFTTVTGAFFNEDIYGGINADTLIGNEGNDRLTGAEGADTFVFSSGDGQDIILDFDETSDMLDFSAVDAPIFNLHQQGTDVLIEYDIQGDSILIKDKVVDQISHHIPHINTIDGRGTGDTPLFGTVGQDIILAEGGTGKNGYLFGAGKNPGPDIFVSLGGSSYLMYRESNIGLTFDLENRTAHGGDAEGDTWVGEWSNIQGTNFDDIFWGSSGSDFVWLHQGNDQFYGYAGDDIIRWSGGNDIIDGGEGFDTVLYSWDHQKNMNIDIFSEDDPRKPSNTTTYISVEHLITHKQNDTINIGSGTSLQIVDGERGNDTFNIFANSGIFTGGAGADSFIFNPDNLMSSQTNVTVSDFSTFDDLLIILDNSISLDEKQSLPDGFSYGSDESGDLMIHFGDNDTLTLTGIDSYGYV